MNTLEELITEDTLEFVFGYSDFGDLSKRDVVRLALLKVACGYPNGSTSNQILIELELITKSQELTGSGKDYLWQAFAGNKNHLKH